MSRKLNHHRIVALSVASALALTLQACASSGGADALTPITPLSRYTLQVEPGIDRVALAVHETGVSANQQAVLGQLASRFMIEGAPVIYVEAPAGGDPVANNAAWQTAAVLEAAGVPASLIQVVSYNGPDPRAPVLAGFETVRAHVPQCGTSWENLARTGTRNSNNLGCAVNANLAAQIANPRDILQPRSLDAADAGRRGTVVGNYRSGQITSGPVEPLLAQRLSQSVQQ